MSPELTTASFEFWQPAVVAAIIAAVTSIIATVLTNWLAGRRARRELVIAAQNEINKLQVIAQNELQKVRQEIEHKVKIETYLKVLNSISKLLNSNIEVPLATMPMFLFADDETIKKIAAASRMGRDATSQAPAVSAFGEFILQMRKEVLKADTTVTVEDIIYSVADERRTEIWRGEQQ